MADAREARRPTGRCSRPASTLLATALTLLAATGCSDHGGSTPGGGKSGAQAVAVSCVSPVLGTTPSPAPAAPGEPPDLGHVARGQSVTVYGIWYFAGPCRDTVTSRDAATGGRAPSAAPAEKVHLTLHAADGRSFPLATVEPDKEASFTATLEIPMAAAAGPADITDDFGHEVRLFISAS